MKNYLKASFIIIFSFSLLLLGALWVRSYSTYGAPTEFGNATTTTCWIGGDFGVINCTGNVTAKFYKNSSGSIEWITPSHIFDVDDADIETDLNTYVDIAGDTMTGNLVLDDGVGESPKLEFYNQLDNISQIYEQTSGDLYLSVCNAFEVNALSYRFNTLTSCDTIDTDASGVLSCGSDAGVGTESDPIWSANFSNMQADCPSGNYSYGIQVNGTYKCRSDVDTTYTAGDALTLTGTDFDFDGGATPGGELGNTWASPTLDNDALDDQYYDSEADLTGLLDDNYADIKWGYNMTTNSIYYYNASTATYSMYGLWFYNMTSNSIYFYNQTTPAIDASVQRDDWTTIDNYPSDCSAGSYVTGLADTLTCTADPLDTIVEWQTLCTNCVQDGDVVDSLTATNYVRKSTWTDINDYPSACAAGEFVSQIGDTLTCGDPLVTKTSYLSIPPAAFTGAYPDTDDLIVHPADLEFSGSHQVFAPAFLPHGAVITAAVLNGSDSTETWYFSRANFSGGMELLASALVNAENSSISVFTRDNQNFSYVFHTTAHELGDKIYGARLTYSTSYD